MSSKPLDFQLMDNQPPVPAGTLYVRFLADAPGTNPRRLSGYVPIGGGGGTVGAGFIPFGEVVSISAGTTSGTLSHAPSPISFLTFTKNGVTLEQGAGNDYTISGTSITLAVAAVTGDIFQAFYTYNLQTTPTPFGETVSIAPSSTSGTLSFAPNPTSFLLFSKNGIILDQGVDYTLSGTSITLSVAAVAGDIFQAFYFYNPAPVSSPFGEVVAIGAGTTTGTLSHTPNPTSFLQFKKNGVTLQQGTGNDYTLLGAVVTLAVAALSTDIFQAFYLY